jgi:hypothetical protein
MVFLSLIKTWEDKAVIHIVVIGRTVSLRGSVRNPQEVKDHIVAAASLRIIDNLALILWLGVSASKYDKNWGNPETEKNYPTSQHTFNLSKFVVAVCQDLIFIKQHHYLTGNQVYNNEEKGAIPFYNKNVAFEQ